MNELRAVAETKINGVMVLELTRHADERGSFTEIYRTEWVPEGREMVQGNLSFSRPGVLRGLHFHRRQSDYWVLLEGHAFVGLYDLRVDSPTRGAAAGISLGAEASDRALFIPPGVAHGFLAETGVRLLYLVDVSYDEADEFGIAWNDPDVGIAWPVTDPVVSERDRGNPSLAAVLRDPLHMG